MKKKVRAVRHLMADLEVTVEDLLIYDDSIEKSGKFPLEIYFSDGAISNEVGYYNASVVFKVREAIGVVIGNTVYAFRRQLMNKLGTGEEMCKVAFGHGLVGTLPTIEQVGVLADNLIDYNRILISLEKEKITKGEEIAIAHNDNKDNRQFCCLIGQGAESVSHHFLTAVLPVINL